MEVDAGPMARLEVVKSDVETAGVVFQRLSEGETLGEIAKGWGVPRGRFTQWYMEEHVGLYDAALKVLAQADAQETVEIADASTPESVGSDKLRISSRQWRSSKWDRERYGEKTQVQHSGLVPTLTIEIVGVAQAAQGRVIEQEPVKIEDGLI